ncbi:MAG TPA: nucleotidyltransferase domain-containing protein [Tenuifilaceae bacterium]|nr:nucleotidyltransferase domain-containing protein [Tenuifilaceae bacterium]
MRFGLKDSTIEQVNSVFTQFSFVEKVVIYGSRAKGNFEEGSDIDITLIGENITQNYLNKISLKLDDLLLPYKFDISVFNQISNPNLVDHIQRIGQVFYEKK